MTYTVHILGYTKTFEDFMSAQKWVDENNDHGDPYEISRIVETVVERG